MKLVYLFSEIKSMIFQLQNLFEFSQFFLIRTRSIRRKEKRINRDIKLNFAPHTHHMTLVKSFIATSDWENRVRLNAVGTDLKAHVQGWLAALLLSFLPTGWIWRGRESKGKEKETRRERERPVEKAKKRRSYSLHNYRQATKIHSFLSLKAQSITT